MARTKQKKKHEEEKKELKNLRKSMSSVKALVSTFSSNRGENPGIELDLLLEKLKAIVNTNPESHSLSLSTSTVEDPLPATSTTAASTKRKLECLSETAVNSETAAKRLRDESSKIGQNIEAGPTPKDHSIFATESVMLQILKHLPDQQLIAYRRVNSNFKIFATEILRTRASFQIQFKFNWSTQAYSKSYSSQSKSQSQSYALQNFTQFLKRFSKEGCEFPCTSFSFKCGTLDSEDLQKFFLTHGNLVQKLALDLFDPPKLPSGQIHIQVQNQSPNQPLIQHPPPPPPPPPPNQIPVQLGLQPLNHNQGLIPPPIMQPPLQARMSINRPLMHPQQWPSNGVPLPEKAPITPMVPAFSNYPTVYLLRKLLVSHLPQLEHLTLNKFPPQWKTLLTLHRLFPEPKGNEIFIPKLKTLSLPYDVPDKIFEDLLKAGNNLQEFLPEPTYFIRIGPILKAQKFGLIKSLLWMPNSLDIELCEKMLPSIRAGGVQLETLVLSMGWTIGHSSLWPRVSKVFKAILDASSPELRTFGFATPMGALCDLKFPQFPKVTELKIGAPTFPHRLSQNTTRSTKKMFPVGCQLKIVFPEVKTVTFSIQNLTSVDKWEDYFDNSFEPMPSVKELFIRQMEVVPIGWMSRLALLFPNIEKLVIKSVNFNYFHAANGGLWTFLKLKELTCEINVTTPENIYPALESTFTGFPADSIKNLQEAPYDVDLQTVEMFRKHDSIVNLKELQTLRLLFVDRSDEVRPHYPPLLTHLTGIYAFQMIPRLRVSLACNVRQQENLKPLKTALSPIFSYVTLTN